jgi:hypothetical protein
MEAPEDRAARALFLAAMQTAGVGGEVADFERLGRDFRGYLADGRRLAAGVSLEAEPLPVCRLT